MDASEFLVMLVLFVVVAFIFIAGVLVREMVADRRWNAEYAEAQRRVAVGPRPSRRRRRRYYTPTYSRTAESVPIDWGHGSGGNSPGFAAGSSSSGLWDDLDYRD
jgi:hypothetical protein